MGQNRSYHNNCSLYINQKNITYASYIIIILTHKNLSSKAFMHVNFIQSFLIIKHSFHIFWKFHQKFDNDMGQNLSFYDNFSLYINQKNITVTFTFNDSYICICALILYYQKSHSQEPQFKRIYEYKLFTFIVNNIA